MSIAFDRDRRRRQQELPNNQITKGKCHVRVMLIHVLGCTELQEKSTYGVGYKLTLTRKEVVAVLNEGEAIADARIKSDNIHLYVPHYTSTLPQQGILSKQILSKTPMELRFIERSVFMKKIYS